MSAQRLSDKKTKKTAKLTGLSVLRAWSHGDSVMDFVTDDHKHGLLDMKSGRWRFIDNPIHYTSCRELFPNAY